MKKYKIEVTEENDGSLSMSRDNEGFSAFELLGFVAVIQEELVQIIKNGTTVDKKTITENGVEIENPIKPKVKTL